MTRDRLLLLLLRISHAAGDGVMPDRCPECGHRDVIAPGHNERCELAAAITWLHAMPDGVSLHCSDWWARGTAGPPREPAR